MKGKRQQPERAWCEIIRTEPLTVSELATHFRCERNCMRDVVLPTLRAEQVGGKFRIVLADMPPRYLVACGLVQPFALSCTPDRKADTNERRAS
jgi:hypothetical protein